MMAMAHSSKGLQSLHANSRALIAGLPRFFASQSPVLQDKNPTPGTDIQEDSSADSEALRESTKIAKDFDDIKDNYDHEKDGEPTRNPEVADKSGKSFPHQTSEQRAGRKATNTEGEAQVKTREYTPKEDSKLYEEKDGLYSLQEA